MKRLTFLLLLVTLTALAQPKNQTICATNMWYCGFEGGVSGAGITQTALNASVVGPSGWSFVVNHDPTIGSYFISSAQKPLNSPVVLCNGSSAGAGGSMGVFSCTTNITQSFF